MKLTISQVAVKLEGDDFGDIVETAGYGIGYWVPRAEVGDGSYIVHVEADELQNPCPHATVLETYDEGGTAYSRVEITPDDLGGAIADVVTGKFAVRDDIRTWVTEGDLGMYDALVGDVLVQACLFPTLVFG